MSVSIQHCRGNALFEGLEREFPFSAVFHRLGTTYHVRCMATLLQKMNEERAARLERLRFGVREELRSALRDILPRTPVTVFGSLTHAGRFTDASDVDLALAAEPTDSSVYQLIAQLSERLGRRVDVMLLSESRFRDKILREGETWMP